MQNKEQNSELKKKYKRLSLIKAIFLFTNVVILFVLFYFFYKFGANPLIIVLILGFAFLIIVGPVVGGWRKSYYSKLFPDKQEAKKRQRRQKEFIKTRIEPTIPEKKEIQAIDLTVNYKEKKSLILKCTKCGMVLISGTKRCPKCRNPIEY